MATVADKTDAAAEKAYADASSAVSARKEAEATTTKIDNAVEQVKAAPKKAAPRKAKPAARKAAAPKKAVAAKTAAKPAARKTAATKTKTKTTTAKAAPRVAGVAQLKETIMATAKKTADIDFTKTVKEAAADAQTRAKAAYDRVQDYAGDMTEFTKGNVEAIVASGKILGAGMQDMARGEIEAAKTAYQAVAGDLKAMAAIRTPADLFKLQGEIARRNFDAMVAHYSKNAEAGMKLANEAFAPISNRMSLAVEKVRQAA